MYKDFLQLLFPKSCVVCDSQLSDNELPICLFCSEDLPFNPLFEKQDNYTSKLFYGRLNIEHATSLLLFSKKGAVQKLLHELKYRRQEEISTLLGHWTANRLLKTSWVQNIEVIVPVPIHPKRLRQRGYNQVEGFGKVIAKTLDVPYIDNVLVKKRFTRTQVFKKRLDRLESIEDTFKLNKNLDVLSSKHILLVDDVVTTGATLEACGYKLLQVDGVKLSIATMAVTL